DLLATRQAVDCNVAGVSREVDRVAREALDVGARRSARRGGDGITRTAKDRGRSARTKDDRFVPGCAVDIGLCGARVDRVIDAAEHRGGAAAERDRLFRLKAGVQQNCAETPGKVDRV